MYISVCGIKSLATILSVLTKVCSIWIIQAINNGAPLVSIGIPNFYWSIILPNKTYILFIKNSKILLMVFKNILFSALMVIDNITWLRFLKGDSRLICLLFQITFFAIIHCYILSIFSIINTLFYQICIISVKVICFCLKCHILNYIYKLLIFYIFFKFIFMIIFIFYEELGINPFKIFLLDLLWLHLLLPCHLILM